MTPFFYYTQPHPILLQIGIFQLTAHGFFFGLAGFIAAWWFEKSLLKMGINQPGLFAQAVFIMGVGVLGARLAFIILYPSYFHSVLDILSVWRGGLVSYGGMAAGAAIALYLYRGYNSSQRALIASVAVLSGLLGWAIGRFGNFYAGDVIGQGGIAVVVLEAIWCFLLWRLGILVLHREISWKLPWQLLLGYAVGRFCIDYFVIESYFLGLHFSQWGSIAMAIVAIIGLIRSHSYGTLVKN